MKILRALPLLSVLTLTTLASPSSHAAPPDVLAQNVEVDRTRPIVSYISPPHLFPTEGQSFERRNGQSGADSYRPLPAYDKPDGAIIGEVRMANVQCVGKEETPGCSARFGWYLQTAAGARFRLPVDDYEYNTGALVSYEASLAKGAATWSRIQYAKGAFWVSTAARDVVAYESKATQADNFDQWCDAPGKCAPVSRQMQDELARVRDGKYALDTCYDNAYTIEALVSAQGQRYYRVKLVDSQSGKPRPKLPKTGFIPVRTHSGAHTGSFSSVGC